MVQRRWYQDHTAVVVRHAADRPWCGPVVLMIVQVRLPPSLFLFPALSRRYPHGTWFPTIDFIHSIV